MEKEKWLTKDELLDAIAMGQLTPGSVTVIDAVIGYKMSVLAGAVLAMVSSYLPCIAS